MTKRYLEDFVVGQTFGSGRVRVDKERIKTFAAEFDPGRSQARGRYHRRRLRGVALDAAGPARKRAARRERGPGGKAVKIAP